MNSQDQSPVFERLSMIIAIALSTFALGQLFTVPGRLLSFQLSGIYFEFNLSITNIFALINVGIVTTGSYTIFIQRAKRRRISLVHAILPALTTWMISIPLFATGMNLLWWVELILFGGLLLLVIYAEFLVADDIEEQYEQILSRLLESVAFAIFFIISAILFALDMRLTFMLPPLLLLSFFISLRVFELHTNKWLIPEALSSAFIIVQFAAAFNYVRFSAISLGIFLFAIQYTLITLIINLHSETFTRKKAVETVLIFIGTLLIGIFLQIT